MYINNEESEKWIAIVQVVCFQIYNLLYAPDFIFTTFIKLKFRCYLTTFLITQYSPKIEY
jgi:hypothetical protein